MKWKLLGLLLAKSSDHSRLGNNVVFLFWLDRIFCRNKPRPASFYYRSMIVYGLFGSFFGILTSSATRHRVQQFSASEA